MTRFFKVTHKAGAFIDGIHYPCADDQADIQESIVPLEIGKKDKAPLWGVEVDANGNEIGETPIPALDRLGDALGNKIATAAGEKPAQEPKATLSAAEAAARKQTIIDALSLLDHEKDEDWVMNGDSAGKPRVNVIEDATGIKDLTRAEIDAAAPDFIRKKAE